MAITPINVTTSNTTGVVTLSAAGLPAGLTFTDNGNGTGDITGTVAQGEAVNSPFVVTITATDDVATDDETFLLTVTPPALKPNVSGLANPLSATRVLDSFDCSTLSANWTSASDVTGVYEVGHNLIAFLGRVNNPGRLFIVDVSTPSSPTLVSEANILGTDAGTKIADVDVAGKRLYVCEIASGDEIIRAIDISDPALPVQVGGTQTVGAGTLVQDVAFSGSVAATVTYALNSSPTLTLLSDDLSTVHYQQTLTTLLGAASNADRCSLTAKGNYLWINNGGSNDGLHLVDISDPTAPSVLVDSFTNANGGEYTCGVFLTGGTEGDMVAGAFDDGASRTSLIFMPATGAEAQSAARISSVTTTESITTTVGYHQRAILADLNNVVYWGGNTGIDVIDASGAAPFSVDNTLLSNHLISFVGATDGKIIGANGGEISIWT